MIKVGYLVSYDYSMLFTSIIQIYEYVDEIYLAIDCNNKTWSGSSFDLPDSFFIEVAIFDSKNKIKIYKDDFSITDLTPMECEIRERNLLLKKMGKGWLIQLDVDEYVYDFGEIVKYLNKYWYLNIFPKRTPISFTAKLITLYKKAENGYFYVDGDEKLPFITNFPEYTGARRNFNIRNYFINATIIHQSWARSEQEMDFKIKNWGHRDDFDTKKYMDFWKSIDSNNYQYLSNFHPIVPTIWSKLDFIECNSVNEFINKYSSLNKQNLTPYFIKNKKLFFKNLFCRILKI